jgi:hypothetical protein
VCGFHLGSFLFTKDSERKTDAQTENRAKETNLNRIEEYKSRKKDFLRKFISILI